ncbi:tryptophan halogenase family protein [Marinimicrobium sp. ARAG 43.8]|uniref:tryptophan halogenase family protein n=1 Tax=Marinimicrobium sp. ARAG 43.8 TaxID=3418719 RepID=UPI003CF1DE49
MVKPVTSVVIVGGGTAGWITAGTLAARVSQQGHSPTITLIESPNVPIVGVGEGTWPTMRSTLRKMGIRETDFIRRCHASFKQGAKFARWATGKDDDFYYHPLVQPHQFHQLNLAPYWQAQPQHDSFSQAVCPQEALCEQGLAPKLITTPEYEAVANYAYHLDAGAFSEFLKEHCTQHLGVRHLQADVSSVESADNGDIKAVLTEQAGPVEGDLFIDCTGFKSLLLGGHFQVPFRSCKDVLFIDRAIAAHVPYPDEQSPIASHTISTAQDAGWIWDIGLSSRRGAGHVYSSAHTSEEHAHEQLKQYLASSVKDPEALTFRTIDIEPGHRERFWVNNCLAIGLSAGFLEPLEASALVLVEISAAMLAEQFPDNRETMDVVARRFNRTFQYRWDRIIDFLKLHYSLSQRTDSDFWLDNRHPDTIPESLKELTELWRYHPPWHHDFEHAVEVFPAASYQYVLYGMGFETRPTRAHHIDENREGALEAFRANQRAIEQLTQALPSTRTLINKIHEFGLQKV